MYKFHKATEYLNSMCDNIVLKCISVLSAYLVQFHFGDISRQSLVALLMLIAFDFFTGIWAAVHKDEQITSQKLFHTPLKLVLYFVMVSAGHFTEVVIGIPLFIDQTIIIFLVVTELYSVFENVAKAGYETPIRAVKEQLKNLIIKPK